MEDVIAVAFLNTLAEHAALGLNLLAQVAEGDWDCAGRGPEGLEKRHVHAKPGEDGEGEGDPACGERSDGHACGDHVDGLSVKVLKIG